MSLRHGAPHGAPRHTTLPTTVPRQRRATVSVAEALRAQFPLGAEAGRRPATQSVAEALRARFPQPRTPAENDPPPARTYRPAGPALPRRIRRIPVSARQAQPASAALLRRVLDGLQRL